MKKRISPKEQPTVQTFSTTTNMKFQPKSLKATEQLNQKLAKKTQKTSRQNSIICNLGKRLTFVIQVFQHHFLIGNQNQLDFISVGGIVNEFVDVQYFWSLALQGPIEIVQLDPKKNLIAISSLQKLFVYKFNNKKKSELPNLIFTEEVSDELRFIRFPKQQLLVLFFPKHFEAFNFDEALTEMTKTSVRKYCVKQNFVLLDVPPSNQNFLNIFFEEPKKIQAFGLWCINITFDLIKIRIGSIFKIYDIMKKFKKVLQIRNYSKEIIFINLGSELIAAKKGFIIDSVSVNLKNDNSNMRYVGNQKLLHITNKRVEVYNFKVNTVSVPNRIVLKATDSLELGQVPSNSIFLGSSINKDSNITVFFQNLDTKYSNGEIQYWFKTSYSIDRESKMRKIFNYGKEISTIDQEILSSKYDIAEKMGMSEKDIYLQIWNKSSKSTVEDYNFLLATNHYKTIRTEIQNKLRKHTMSYREIVRLQKSCYEMLHKKVFGKANVLNEDTIQDFLTSHYYLKKLNLFKDIKVLKKSTIKNNPNHDHNPQLEQIMTIDIQQYSTFKEFELKQFILDQVSEFCFRKKLNMATEIRHILKQFKFIIRTFYKELLKDIIHTAKSSIIKLLNAVPQILPYKHILDQSQNPGMYQGVWCEISPHQWNENLYLDNIITVENKQMIQGLLETIWFKRNYRIYHILVPKRKEQIINVNKVLNSDTIFYFFLSQIFRNPPIEEYLDFSSISQIVNYLENNFQLFPQHLKSNVFLYYELYQYYKAQQEWKQPKVDLQIFFKLKDYELFRYFFDLQKIKKNCILKQIKPIYKKLHIHGNQIFNQGLLSYFDSEVSELSDLKYILNRINNEKIQFHEQNLSMYQILLKAMQMKIKLGTGQKSQASISEVLVYVENIPTALLMNEQNKKFHEQLNTIKSIQKHEKTLQKMNLNMTIQYMLKRCEDVILKMVDFEIVDKQLFGINDYDFFKKKSIEILEEINNIKDNIYGKVYPNLALFAFATTVLEKEDIVLMLAKLFSQQVIKNLFTYDQNFIQNIVIYAYKWKFSQNSIFVKNQTYITKLFQLLPPQNKTRKFLQCELRLAILLSEPNQDLQYPISVNYVVPKGFQIEQIISFMSMSRLSSLSIEQVSNLLNKMHSISKNKTDFEDQITLQKVYQIFIERFLKESSSYKECLEILKKYYELKNREGKKDKDQCIDEFPAYISIFYIQVCSELNEESRQKMTELLGLLYKKPHYLLQIFEHLIEEKRTGLQTIQYLSKTLKQVNSRQYLCFDPQNSLIQLRLLSETQNEKGKVAPAILNKIVKDSLQNMRVQKQIFRTNQLYNVIFYTICQSPLNCLTILRFYKQKIKYKEFRSYISYLTQEIIFAQNQLIECFVVLFSVLLKNFKYNQEFQTILKNQYLKTQQTTKNHYSIFKQIHQIEIFQTPEQDYYKKLLKSLKRLLRKRNSLVTIGRSRRKIINKAEQIQFMLENQQHIDTTKRSRAKRPQNPYPFSDSDYTYDDDINPNAPKILRRRRKFMKIDFDCQNQRLKMLKRGEEDLTEYLVNTYQLTVKQNPLLPQQTLSQKSSKAQYGSTSHKFKITERKKSVEQQKLKEVHEEQKNKYKVNRNTGTESVPLQYVTTHNMSQLNVQNQGSPRRKSSNQLTSIKTFKDQKDSEDDPFLKRQSMLKSQIGQTISEKLIKPQRKQNVAPPDVQSVKNKLLNSSQDSDLNQIKFFDIKMLAKIKQDSFDQDKQKFGQYLKEIADRIYKSQTHTDSDKLNLINQIVKKFSMEVTFCNRKVLQIYLRFSTLKKSYQVNIDTTKIFEFDGLASQTSDGSHLYSCYCNKILKLMNDENAVKVSRLIALTLRKNSLEQQIIYAYLIKKLREIGASNKGNLEENQEIFLKKIIFSMTIRRFVDYFDEILRVMKECAESNDQCRQNFKKITQMILQSIQTKGDHRAAQELRSKAQSSSNYKIDEEIELKIKTSQCSKYQ